MGESLSMDEARLATIAQLAALLISSLAVDKKSPYAVQPRRGRDLLAILWILRIYVWWLLHDLSPRSTCYNQFLRSVITAGSLLSITNPNGIVTINKHNA